MENKEKGIHEEIRRIDRHASGEEGHLPPRIVKHANKKSKFSRYYSIVLVWLFFLLTIMLIVWGYRVS